MSGSEGCEPESGGRAVTVAIVLGIAIGLISSYATYEFSYGGVPLPDDVYLRGLITALVVMGFLSAIVLIFMGSISHISSGMSGEEITGYSEVRRKRP
jgi:galactitol-specific phosphotransferase system IIC component